MWNSIEALTRIFYASQWATAIFGGLTALAIVIGIVVSVRKDTLIAKQEEDRARQSQQMQTGQNQTIDSLSTNSKNINQSPKKYRVLKIEFAS